MCRIRADDKIFVRNEFLVKNNKHHKCSTVVFGHDGLKLG